MNSDPTRHPSKIQIHLTSTIFLGFLSLAFGLAASPSVAQETTKVTSVESADTSSSVFDSLFDISLGLISEKEFNARLTASGIADFEAELKKSLKDLKGDRVGFRHVTSDQFSKLVRSMEIVSSTQQVVIIGVTKDRAYLEVSLFLSSKSRYVAVVTTKLAELPDAIVKTLTTQKVHPPKLGTQESGKKITVDFRWLESKPIEGRTETKRVSGRISDRFVHSKPVLTVEDIATAQLISVNAANMRQYGVEFTLKADANRKLLASLRNDPALSKQLTVQVTDESGKVRRYGGIYFDKSTGRLRGNPSAGFTPSKALMEKVLKASTR